LNIKKLMNIIKFSLFGTLILSSYLSSIHAHSDWGPCATIYTEPDLQGDSTEICHSGFLSTTFNDQTSSIEIPEGFNMRLFDSSNFTGHFLDIQAGIWNADEEWDNKISSIQYNNWGDGCAVIYTGVNRTGDAFKICNDVMNLTEGYGGAFVSIHVAPLHFFRLFNDYNLTGDWIDVRSTLTLREDWQNQTKSMHLKHWAVCAWFHNDPDGMGRLFQVCDNGTFPDAWANMSVSVTVPKGMTVTAYKLPDFEGETLTLTEGVTNLDDDWKNKIVSVGVVIDGAMKPA